MKHMKLKIRLFKNIEAKIEAKLLRLSVEDEAIKPRQGWPQIVTLRNAVTVKILQIGEANTRHNCKTLNKEEFDR